MGHRGAALLGALLLGLSVFPATGAESVLARFQGSACFARAYDKAHLAKHPVQTVRRISLGRSPIGTAGRTTLRLRVQFRQSSEIFEAEVYCSPNGQSASCGVEGDGGEFSLRLQGETLRMTVGRIALEGSDFVDFGPDDKVLLLRKGRCL